MVMQSPFPNKNRYNTNLSSLEIKVESLEESMNTFTKRYTELLTKNHDRVMSKTDLGNKKMEEIMRRFKVIKENNFCMNAASNMNVFKEVRQELPLLTDETSRQNDVHNEITTFDNAERNHLRDSHARNDQQWSTAANNSITNYKPGHDQASSLTSKPDKKMTNVTLYGTAQGQISDLQLAADIHLVAKGVGKHVTAIHLAEFLESRGMKVVDCELLTTYENARSLSYKVTIKASDYVKSRDPATSPYRITHIGSEENLVQTSRWRI